MALEPVDDVVDAPWDDAREHGSPLWWIRRLERRLADRAPLLRRYDEYYRGEHRLAFATEKFREAFGLMFREFSDNWCDLVVDAVEERLNVEGFRFGGKQADSQAWDIWQANRLDAESQIAHTEALINSEASVLVWPGASGAFPSITVEHPLQTVVECSAANPRDRLAALKEWIDDDGYAMATLYLPTEVWKFRSPRPVRANVAWQRIQWEPRETDSEMWPLPNPFGVVPVLSLVNRPRLLTGGVSELAKVIPIQDAVNKLVLDMIIASEYGAVKRRWATGIEIPKDPATGQPHEPFATAIQRLWATPKTDAKFGEFSETELRNFVVAVEMLVQHIASQTRTPPHYFYLKGQFPSGESIKSAETGLVAKARRKMRHFGEVWEEAIRLAFAAMGDRKKADFVQAETIWGDPESRSEGEHIDATIKLSAIDVPTEALWERAGFTPQQIKRFKKMRAGETPAAVIPEEGRRDA